MIDALLGRRCTSIRRFSHHLAGLAPSEPGPIEFSWDDGTHLTLDANTDWTLDLSQQRWADPYAGVEERERQELAQAVGLWEEAAIPAELNRLVGQVVSFAEPQFNEVGEVTGLQLTFKDVTVVARVLTGELAIEVLDR